MKLSQRSILSAILTVVACVAGASTVWAAGKAEKKKLLFFTKSSGFEHPVIKVTDGGPSFAQKNLEELGSENGFEITSTKDGTVFTAETLAKYDGFVFYTTG